MSALIRVRPAALTDLPRLGKLGALLVQAHHDFDAKRFLPSRDRLPLDYERFLRSQLQEADAIVLVATVNDDVIGYAYATIEGVDYMALRGPAGVLQDIIVDPASRGGGAGSLLLTAMMSALKARNVTQVVLMTAARNEAAQQLFAHAGFRPTMMEMTRDFDDDHT